jgi:DNA-binding response OmpR family regulator
MVMSRESRSRLLADAPPLPAELGCPPASRVVIAGEASEAASLLARRLQADGVGATVAESVEAALAAARSGQADLLVLDLVSLDEGRVTLVEALCRAGVGVPVILLTARQDIERAVAALHGGADDFTTKPFCVEELLARVRLRLRGRWVEDPAVLRHGPLELDLRARRARIEGRPVDLTAREFLLAETFVRNRDRVLSRQQLLSLVWGYLHDTESNVVDVYVCSLRRKLGRSLITTVRGTGYRLGAATASPPRRRTA